MDDQVYECLVKGLGRLVFIQGDGLLYGVLMVLGLLRILRLAADLQTGKQAVGCLLEPGLAGCVLVLR